MSEPKSGVITQEQLERAQAVTREAAGQPDEPEDDTTEDGAEGADQEETRDDDGGDGQETVENEDGEGEGGSPGETIDATLAAVADAAGIEVEDFYSIEIPMGTDGSTLTVGELKNAVTDITAREGALNADRENLETRTIRQNQDLQWVISQLPEIPQTLIDQAAEARQEQIASQRKQMFAVKREWQDAEVFNKAVDAAATLAADFGFSRPEALNAIQMDHRLMLMAHQHSELKKRLAEGAASFETLKDEARTSKRVAESQRTDKADGQKKLNLKQRALETKSPEDMVAFARSLQG